MQSVNFKSSSAQAAAIAAQAKVAPCVWKNKLDTAQSDNVGRLLLKAGVITREQFCDAQEIAESLKKSIDQVLATSFLNEFQAEICGSAISFLERGLIAESLAADGLMMAHKKHISFFEGLRYFGYGW